MKHKPSEKPGGLNCALCDFTSVSNVKIIKHMKTKHTETGLSVPNVIPVQTLLLEDVSVCVVSDSEESGQMRVEELLIETKSCTECDFEAPDED